MAAWMGQGGWRYESISFASPLEPGGESYYKVSISIKGTDLAFEFVSEGVEEGRIRHAFSESRRLPVLCGGLPGAPHGEEEDVETAKDILEQEIANLTSA